MMRVMSTQQTVTDLVVRVALLALTAFGITNADLATAVQAALVAAVGLVFAVMTWQRGKTARRSDALSVQAAQVRVNQIAAEKALQAAPVDVGQLTALTQDILANMPTETTPALPDTLAHLDRILRDPGALARLATVLNDTRSGTLATGPTLPTPARHDVEESAR